MTSAYYDSYGALRAVVIASQSLEPEGSHRSSSAFEVGDIGEYWVFFEAKDVAEFIKWRRNIKKKGLLSFAFKAIEPINSFYWETELNRD